MMRRQDIQESIYQYISEQMNCRVKDLYAGGTIFVEARNKTPKYIKILSVQDTNIVAISSDLFPEVTRHLDGKNRDELYESDYVFGQTLHYIPDIKQMQPWPFPEEYTFELLTGDEIEKLKGIQGFDNSLSFDEDGNTPTCIVLYAKKDEQIIALAGASYVPQNPCTSTGGLNETMSNQHCLREVGIDVQREFRGKKLASLLVHNLTAELLRQGKIPFYSASVTNIASQAVAIRSGYMPLWTDTFGVRDIWKSGK